MHEMDITQRRRARARLRLHRPAARRPVAQAAAPPRWAIRRARPGASTSSRASSPTTAPSSTACASYKGPLYAEVSPRTFSVLVRKGSRLSQLRIRRGNPPSSDEDMRRLHQESAASSAGDHRRRHPQRRAGLGRRARRASGGADRLSREDPRRPHRHRQGASLRRGGFLGAGARAAPRRSHPRPGRVLHPRLARPGEDPADARRRDDRLRHAGRRVPRALRGLLRSRLRPSRRGRRRLRAPCSKCAPTKCRSCIEHGQIVGRLTVRTAHLAAARSSTARA